jgi:DedD protein
MGLFSFFKSSRARRPEQTAPLSEDGMADIRLRARRRLLGAVVLVLAAVVGLPLILETQPRPVAKDISIDVRRDSGAATVTDSPFAGARPLGESVDAANQSPVTVGTAKPAAVDPALRSPALVAPVVAAPLDAASGGGFKPPTPAKVVTAAPVAPARPAVPAPVVSPRVAAAAPAAPPKPTAAPRPEDKSPAKPAPEIKPAAAAGTRFVLQVGAFEHAAAARETRGKVEKLGLKAYEQEVDAAGARRIRVRLGPYASREEADRMLQKLRAGGMNASVVPL